MFLSKEDSDNLWEGVKRHDSELFNPVNKKLLNPQGVSLRNIPVRLYLPHSADEKPLLKSNSDDRKAPKGEEVTPGSIRVVQGVVPVARSSRKSGLMRRFEVLFNSVLRQNLGQRQTIGTALNNILPGLFPNTRLPLVAEPVLHGATLPLDASVEELVQTTAYCDGWLHIAFVIF